MPSQEEVAVEKPDTDTSARKDSTAKVKTSRKKSLPGYWHAVRLVVIGFIVFVPLFVFGDRLSEDAWNTLLGVIMGGIIAAVGTMYINDLEKRDAEQTKKVALAHSVLFKVRTATDYLIKVNNLVFSSIAIAKSRKIALWQAMEEFFGATHTPIEMDVEEMILFSGSGEAEFGNDIGEVFSIYNFMIDLLARYNQKKEELNQWSMQNAKISVSGKVASFEVADPNVSLLIARLDELANYVAKYSLEAMGEPLSTANRLSPKLVEILNDKRFNVTIVFPAPAGEPPKAAPPKPPPQHPPG